MPLHNFRSAILLETSWTQHTLKSSSESPYVGVGEPPAFPLAKGCFSVAELQTQMSTLFGQTFPGVAHRCYGLAAGAKISQNICSCKERWHVVLPSFFNIYAKERYYRAKRKELDYREEL
jgi:hypothetical protein